MSGNNNPTLTVDSTRAPGQGTPVRTDSVTLQSNEGAVDEKSRQSHNDEKTTQVDHSGDAEKGAQGRSDHFEMHYVTGFKLVLIFIGMLLSVFLIALDQTIIATAIPKIASDFDALQQVTWIASGYFLTQSSLILTYGQLLAVANTKWVYLAAVTIFEIGSAICGSAPNINVLIFGRAVAGVGAAGIFTAALSIIARVTRLEQRPILFGAFAAVFALSSVVGPLLGGVFTDHVSWRWCFYINLPIGGITILSILLVIKPEHSIPPAESDKPTWKRLLGLDWVGSVLSVGLITSLLLPLQWGGVTKKWSDGSVIAPLCVFAVILPTFIAWEWYKGPKALMPLTLWKVDTQIGACAEAFFVMLMLLLCTYYLPLYYQSALKHSATKSGIDILTYMICTVGGAMVAGVIIKQTGRPKPFLLYSPLLASLGAGLVYWDLTGPMNKNHLYGFQVLLGLGVGGALQNTIIVIQAEYQDNPRMVPQSTSLVNFTQLTGGIIGIAIAGTIFGNHLSSAIAKYAPDLSSDVALAVRESVTVIYTLKGADQANVIRAYSEALGYVFIIGIPAGIFASLSALLIKNFNLREMNLEMGAGAA